MGTATAPQGCHGSLAPATGTASVPTSLLSPRPSRGLGAAGTFGGHRGRKVGQGRLVPVPPAGTHTIHTHTPPPGPLRLWRPRQGGGTYRYLGGAAPRALSHQNSSLLHRDTPSVYSGSATPSAWGQKISVPSFLGLLSPLSVPPFRPSTAPPPWLVRMGTCAHRGTTERLFGGTTVLLQRGVSLGMLQGMSFTVVLRMSTRMSTRMSHGILLPSEKTICSQEGLDGSGHCSPPMPKPGTQQLSDHPGWGHPKPPNPAAGSPARQWRRIKVGDPRRVPGASPGPRRFKQAVPEC